MEFGDYLNWQVTNGLLLISLVFGLVRLVGRFTERDWLFLETMADRNWIRFGAFFLVVVIVVLGMPFLVLAHDSEADN
jgi:hypothetical protein